MEKTSLHFTSLHFTTLRLKRKINFCPQYGFTLIELSIVLVIIGLIVGGVLVGQDLIKAAEVRAQISQIEKFNTAVRTFKIKYGYLPGDIPNPYATQFGFVARGTNAGQGDGNGIIQGTCYGGAEPVGAYGYFTGEQGAVWVDLTTANLLNGAAYVAWPNAVDPNGPVTDSTSPGIIDYFPRGKIGNSFVYVWSGGVPALHWASDPPPSDGNNYFALSHPSFTHDCQESETYPLTCLVPKSYGLD